MEFIYMNTEFCISQCRAAAVSNPTEAMSLAHHLYEMILCSQQLGTMTTSQCHLLIREQHIQWSSRFKRVNQGGQLLPSNSTDQVIRTFLH
jgi:hypothetical protein